MQRISLYAHPHLRNSGSYFGYAYTYQEIQKHLSNYEYNNEKLQVDLNSPKSKIQIYYGSPDGIFYPHQYKIQMTQWESSLVPPSWVEHAKGYDEWWTANQFGADAMIRSGIPKEKVFIYEHGVDADIWTPKMRGTNNKIRFLHIDSGSPRKRSDLALKAFKAVFGDDPNYELTLKWSYTKDSKHDWSKNEVLSKVGKWDKNVRKIEENIPLDGLVNLFHYHDVLLYPSEGEGFGLIPLQALVTGMPVISTGVWCSYEKYLLGNIIGSKMGTSSIKEKYDRFGDVVLPDIKSLMNLMKNTAENIEKQSKDFFDQVPLVTSEYDWQKQTNKAMDSLISRVGIEMFDTDKSYLSYLRY